MTARLLAGIIVCLSAGHAPAALVINEFLASNSGGLRDEAGERDDWIELHNPTAAPVDPSGLYLSDSLRSPLKWRLPAGMAPVPPGGFLIVWADNQPEQGPLHATFALSASGEDIALTAADGTTLLDSVRFGPQLADISTGRFPDAIGPWQVMTQPTPGAPNGAGVPGITGPVTANPPRGLRTAPATVSLSTSTAGATIHYTLDGATPTTDSPVYTAPLTITATTTLRARAFRGDYLPGRTATHTYLFPADVIRQSPAGQAPGPGWPAPNANDAAGQVMDYGMDPNIVDDPRYRDRMVGALTQLPSISIVTDLPHLFDRETGLYANAPLRSEEFERPVSVELLNPDGRPGFQVNAGARMRGSSSLAYSNPKHAFRLFFRAEYGDARLEYPLFGDEGVSRFEKVDLRCEQNFSWARGMLSGVTMTRELLWRDAQGAMGQPYTRSRQYHLYLNGHYWGIYMTQERADAWFAADYLGGERADYDVIKANAEATHVTGPSDGDIAAWQRLWEAANAGLGSDAAYQRLLGRDADGTPNPALEVQLDEANLIDYQLLVFFSGSVDGPLGKWSGDTLVNNYYAIRRRDGARGWVHLVHDFETTMMDITESRLGPYPAGAQLKDFSAQWLHQQLTAHPEYRMQFADRVQRHFFNGGVLTSGWLRARLDARTAEISEAVLAESARWGDAKQEPPATPDGHWAPAVAWVRETFLGVRPAIVLAQLRGAGLFPNVEAPVYTINGAPRHGGAVPAGARLGFAAVPNGHQIHYTLDGTDPRLPFTAETVEVPLVDASLLRRAFIPVGPINLGWAALDFDDSPWQAGPGAVGFEGATGYESLIGVDVRAMNGVNASCLIRIPFTLDSAAGLAAPRLAMRYDDGFVAYLNGTEIARRNAPAGNPAWNAAATAGNADSRAVQWEPIALGPGAAALLRSGRNVLAIHGLNAGLVSSDFLIDARLDATRGATGGGAPAPGARLHAGESVRLTTPTTVRARTRAADGTWSALLEAEFTPDPAGPDQWLLF